MIRSWMIVVLVLFTITKASTTPPSHNTVQCGNLTCYHEAICRDDGHGSQRCRCRVGYIGKTCSADLNECDRGSPCMHRGNCHNTIGSYRCECLEGWSGDVHCEIKTAATPKCMHGWLGEFCQDRSINDSMCRMTEVCKKRGRGHHCICAPGWHGINCTSDIDECAKTPCPNNATCFNTQGSYECLCLSSWKEGSCNKDIDECVMHPCQHASVCTNEEGYYNCTCALGWRGEIASTISMNV